MQDRLSSLELRVQQQDDELTVMKAALADVLRRLALSEDTAAAAKKQQSSKGNRTLCVCLPPVILTRFTCRKCWSHAKAGSVNNFNPTLTHGGQHFHLKSSCVCVGV